MQNSNALGSSVVRVAAFAFFVGAGFAVTSEALGAEISDVGLLTAGIVLAIALFIAAIVFGFLERRNEAFAAFLFAVLFPVFFLLNQLAIMVFRFVVERFR